MGRGINVALLCVTVISCQNFGTGASTPAVEAEAGTPEKAMESFRNAVTKGDMAAVYSLLSDPSRDFVDDVQQTNQRCLAMIDQEYPKKLGQVATVERARFVRGDKGAEFLKAYEAKYGLFKTFRRKRLAHVTRNLFSKGRDGRWGFTNLEPQLGDLKNRYRHMEKVIRENLDAIARSDFRDPPSQ